MILKNRFVSIIGALGLGACLLTSVAHAQTANNTALIKRVTLSTFGSDSGNDCWGYVSPSGREYAIMGCNNLIAFVEITNPANPVILETIPHTSSTWGDIKVYGHHAYAVTEASGTGIQVVDMSDIDNGNVTLVRTIASPGRTHNLALDTTSGFLYTCGSRNGTGTTMCFSLANPSNPVQVGPASMTERYQHDGQAVTYTSGPLAGKQLWFGCSEDRGVDIYDFTDKNNPVLIKTVVYPDMGYCHQGWLSEDRKYFYVDDEFDEGQLGVTTRSLIFNVEDPYNATFVDSFSTGVNATDHNQYVTDGFTFQANYRSGLRIFDLQNPESPVQVGWYDTYPTSNGSAMDGAWSCYPFFPSGNVIISDIQGGLYIIDATAALTRQRLPVAFNMQEGMATGALATLLASDNQYLSLVPWTNSRTDRFYVKLEVTTTTVDKSPLKASVYVEAKSNQAQCIQAVDVFNWVTNTYEQVDSRVVGLTDAAATIPLSGNLSRFVNPVTLEMKTRYRYSPQRLESNRLNVFVDQVKVSVTR